MAFLQEVKEQNDVLLTSSIVFDSTFMGWTAAASSRACLSSKFLLVSTNSCTYTTWKENIIYTLQWKSSSYH